MKTGEVCGRRKCGYRLLFLLIAIALMCPVLGTPSMALAQDEPGQTDPARDFSEWPDDEFFMVWPTQTSGVQRMSLYEPRSDLFGATEVEYVEYAGADAHDAVAAVGSRLLTYEHDSILLAFRHNSTQVGLRFFAPATTDPIAALADLAPCVSGADFFDLAAGDVDGELAADGEFREEAVVAWAGASADNKLPVTVAVLSFSEASEASPHPTAVTTAAASAKLDAADIISGLISPVDNALSVAVGDFDGDGAKEIALAYLTAPGTLNIDLFRYSVALENGQLKRSLTRVGNTTINLWSGYAFNATLSVVADDFDGDGRAELWLGTVGRSADKETCHLYGYRVTCADGVDCSVSPDLKLTLASNTTPESGPALGRHGQIQLASGLFHVEPENPNRHQLVVGFYLANSLTVRTGLVDTDLAVEYSSPQTFTNLDKFWIAAGGLKGDRTGSDPTWSMALGLRTTDSHMFVYLHQDSFPNAPRIQWISPPATGDGIRCPVVAADTDGDSMYLGAPIHMVLYDVLNIDFLLQEPPKHAYWDPALAQVYSVSRTDDFNITMVDSNSESFSTKSTDSTDWSIGASLGGSASATVKENASAVIVKESAELSAGISAKIGYDYKQHESSWNSNFQQRTVSFSGSTNKDDYVVGRLQTLDIWRYRVFGIDATDPNQSPFYEIVIPGISTGLNGEIGNIQTDAGGLNFDWYQPTHENGNILSYPEYNSSTFSPADLGSYTVPCEPGTDGCVDGQKTITELMLEPSVKYCDGNAGSVALTFSSESGSGEEHSSSHTLTENAGVKGSAKVEVTVGGKRNNVSTAAQFSAEAELHNSNSWGSSETSDYKTSSSTGITLNRKGCGANNAYAYYPVLYQTTDGTIKATFAVDPLGSNSGKQWWIDHYGQQPDVALNLPQRFYSWMSQWNTLNWTPTSSAQRKQMRGFFVRHNEPNDVSGVYDEYTGAVLDGETARLEARIYNYSVTKGVPAGAKVRFDAVPYDATSNKETGTRSTIGTATLPALAPRQMVTVAVPWDTTDKSLGAMQMYRVYVVLDPENTVAEKYEIESKATQFYFTVDGSNPAGGYWTSCADLSDPEAAELNCIDPAQNNEGYGYVTVSKLPPTGGPGHQLDADVSMGEEGLAAMNAEGELVPGPLEAMAGRPLEIRVTVHSDTPGTGFSHVLVFDGDPQQGGVAIAGKKIFVGNANPEGSSVWFEWVPSKAGPHELHAMVTEASGDAQPGNNTDTMVVSVQSPGTRSFLPLVRNE